jgi:hypothetical protein
LKAYRVIVVARLVGRLLIPPRWAMKRIRPSECTLNTDSSNLPIALTSRFDMLRIVTGIYIRIESSRISNVHTIVNIQTVSDRAQNHTLSIHGQSTVIQQTFSKVLIHTCYADMTEE